GTSEMLGWMVDEKDIEPHVPVWDKAQRKDGTLGRSDFTWDADAAAYRCPRGKQLRSSGKPTADNTLIYRSNFHDCAGCELKSKCCPNTTHRKIARQVNEAAREVARQLAKTKRYEQSRRHRKKVEMLFAHLKRILKLDRLRLHGLKGARDEFLLAATAQNLRRMAAWLMPKGPETAIAPAL
ncbi:transposase, partial [Arenimonas sp. SCN 70-307]|uniref:transposase n=1 Tax=Arenimonas sp. SCN 70-307 TaxID=1660089 RepID=UPI0025B89A71